MITLPKPPAGDWITIDINPCPKPRMTRADRWKKRPAVMKYWAFKDKLLLLCKEKPKGEVFLIFHVPMPKSWSQKKKDKMLGEKHQQRPDIDNYTKAFLDCLCEEDSHVWHTDCYKYWAVEGSIEYETR